MDRRKAGGDSGLEALRVRKRRISDAVYAVLRADLLLPHREHPKLFTNRARYMTANRWS